MRRFPLLVVLLAVALAVGACKKDGPAAPGAPQQPAGQTPAQASGDAGGGAPEVSAPQPERVKGIPSFDGIDSADWPDACRKAVHCADAWLKSGKDSPIKGVASEWKAAPAKIAADPPSWADRCAKAHEELREADGAPQTCN